MFCHDTLISDAVTFRADDIRPYGGDGEYNTRLSDTTTLRVDLGRK